MKPSVSLKSQSSAVALETGAALALAAAATSAAGAQTPSDTKPVQDLIDGIRSSNENVSSQACDSAANYGPAAIHPLALEMGSSDVETARKAKRALCNLVRRAPRPGAQTEAAAVQDKLLAELHAGTQLPIPARREIIWLLSEIGTSTAVPDLAQLLDDPELREDARCALTRLPFPQAVAALSAALPKAEEKFKYALADSLRSRGQNVDSYPTRKMTPVAQTTVTPKK